MCSPREYTYSIPTAVYLVLLPKSKALELPKEHEMPAKDKYTIFSAWDKGYRKGIHKVPKFTRVSYQPFLYSLTDLKLLFFVS
jgi:hypothetical protein